MGWVKDSLIDALATLYAWYGAGAAAASYLYHRLAPAADSASFPVHGGGAYTQAHILRHRLPANEFRAITWVYANYPVPDAAAWRRATHWFGMPPGEPFSYTVWFRGDIAARDVGVRLRAAADGGLAVDLTHDPANTTAPSLDFAFNTILRRAGLLDAAAAAARRAELLKSMAAFAGDTAK